MVEVITNKDFDKIKGIGYGFFSRKGGFSSGEFESLNVNSSQINGEPLENVEKNLEVIQRYFESPNRVFKIKQIHTDRVFYLDSLKDIDRRFIAEGDAIITKLENVVIGVSTADCVPLFLVDEYNRVIAAIHAGWRSAVSGIIENTISKMMEIGAKIENIKAVIGPHLRIANFEIKEDFVDTIKENDENSLCFIYERDNKIFFNITGYVKDVLTNLFISNIYDVNLDTYDNPELFFSYRRSCHAGKKQYGCQFSAIVLK